MTTKPREDIRMQSELKFVPDALYRYTWPGQNPVTVNGDTLTELCKGADASMLNIELVSLKKEEAPVAFPVPPMSLKETDAVLAAYTLDDKEKIVT